MATDWGQEAESQRVDETLNIGTGTGEQKAHDVAYLESICRYIVVWADNQDGDYDIKAQLVSPAGALDGSAYFIAATSDAEYAARVDTDHAGGGVVF